MNQTLKFALLGLATGGSAFAAIAFYNAQNYIPAVLFLIVFALSSTTLKKAIAYYRIEKENKAKQAQTQNKSVPKQNYNQTSSKNVNQKKKK